MWTLLFLFGLFCFAPSAFLIIVVLLQKLWPILLILLGVFIVAICSPGAGNSEREKPEQTKKTNVNCNRIKMEGKIGKTNPTENKGVTQDYATYYTIFRGKK